MTKNTFCAISCGSVLLTTATAAVQINQHRVISGFAAPGSHVSCLDNGSCATRTGANSKFELILWNKSCKCASIAVQKQNFVDIQAVIFGIVVESNLAEIGKLRLRKVIECSDVLESHHG